MERKEKAQSCYTYIVRCQDDTLYTGWTTDLARRITAHNSGKGAKYTKGRGPVVLRHGEHFATNVEAMSREYEIKQLSRREKIALIEGGSPEEKKSPGREDPDKSRDLSGGGS